MYRSVCIICVGSKTQGPSAFKPQSSSVNVLTKTGSVTNRSIYTIVLVVGYWLVGRLLRCKNEKASWELKGKTIQGVNLNKDVRVL